MQISTTARYAVRATLDIALHETYEAGVRAGDIAARTGIPSRFLGTVLLLLGKARVVTGKRGPGGGHRLALPAHSIRISLVVGAIDPAGQADAGSCPPVGDPAEAAVYGLWREVADAAWAILQETTIEDLRARSLAAGAYDFCI